MKFKYQSRHFNKGDLISVELDKQANVILLDSLNFSKFKNGGKYKYYGGLATYSPFKITIPSAGMWYVVIHLGGYSGTVKYKINVISD
ncbi:MAG: DUF1883 domain-containing protein [Paraclostridium sp.]